MTSLAGESVAWKVVLQSSSSRPARRRLPTTTRAKCRQSRIRSTFTAAISMNPSRVASPENLAYFHRNQQYSIVAISNTSGAVIERYSYTANGQPTVYDAAGTIIPAPTFGNRFTYTGREWDATIALHYFRARWHDPLGGRFISRDPLGYVDGMGLYNAYFGLTGIDPTGLDTEWHGPWMGLMQVSVFYGPWQCRQEWIDYCKAKCESRGLESKGCVWIADIRTQIKIGPNFRVGYEAVTYCCCNYQRCDKDIREQSQRRWDNFRDAFWRPVDRNWGGSTMRSNGQRWPVHHVDPREFGGHPTVVENLIPLPPEVHASVHYAYRVCSGKTAGFTDYSIAGPDWPHGGAPALGTIVDPRSPTPPHIPGADGTTWK